MKQTGNNLNMRMLNCIQNQSKQAQKVVLFGSDIPGLTSNIIKNGVEMLDYNDAILGPSTDGGYYLIGFKNFSGNDKQSIDFQPENIRESLENKKLIFSELVQLSDIDYPADLLVI